MEKFEITIPITDDTISEGTEYFDLELQYPTGGAGLGSINIARINILDNEPVVVSTPSVTTSSGNTITSGSISGLNVSIKTKSKNKKKDLLNNKFAPVISCSAQCSISSNISISASLAKRLGLLSKKNKVLKNYTLSSFNSATSNPSNVNTKFKVSSRIKRKIQKFKKYFFSADYIYNRSVRP